ncbi:unnamed protein product [Staurois parvus]|uniref:Uncharacterized protein n=1 Tax=Staurois parvus TaxID=386267 RepID=A0ABN9G0F3_9NEOB|nr:unnamed protein product [Staurois parvus]
MGPLTGPLALEQCPSFQMLLAGRRGGKPAALQGRTDNSWGPRAIGDHGAPVSLPKLKKVYEKGTRGISWGPLLTIGPRAVPKFPNGQSTPGSLYSS